MTFDFKSYNRVWMRKYRLKKKRERLFASGKCPIVGILLTSKYHYKDCKCGYFHTNLDHKDDKV